MFISLIHAALKTAVHALSTVETSNGSQEFKDEAAKLRESIQHFLRFF